MIRKGDWEAAGDEMLAENRRAAGPPPSADEVLAFFNGGLAGAEAERVRNLLVCYPELARVALAKFPSSEETAGDDFLLLSDDEKARDWASLRSRMRPAAAGAPVHELYFWRSLAAAATIAVIVLGGLVIRMKGVEQDLSRELREPRFIGEPQLLLPEGSRGLANAVMELPPHTTDFVLQPSLIDQPSYPDYRIGIIDAATPPRTIWTGRGIRRRSNDTFEIRVSRALLEPGTYRLVIDGIDGAQSKRLASYAFHVPPR